jgi:hypothetical protein
VVRNWQKKEKNMFFFKQLKTLKIYLKKKETKKVNTGNALSIQE